MGCWGVSVGASGYQQCLVGASGCPWVLVVPGECRQMPVGARGVSVGTSGCQWVPVGVNGCQQCLVGAGGVLVGCW